MPFLLVPLLLGITGISVTGLVGKMFADEVDETVNNVTPPLVTLGALALAGGALYLAVRSKR